MYGEGKFDHPTHFGPSWGAPEEEKAWYDPTSWFSDDKYATSENEPLPPGTSENEPLPPPRRSPRRAPPPSVVTAGGSSAAGLATAAATAAATVPVAGWIAGGALAAAAGTVALVSGIRNGRVRRAQAIKWAKELGLPNPGTVPGFVVKLSKKPRSWRMRRLAYHKKQLARLRRSQRKWKRRPGARRTGQVLTLGIMRGPRRLRRKIKQTSAKVRLIEAVNRVYREKRKTRKRKKIERRTRRQEAARQAQLTSVSPARLVDKTFEEETNPLTRKVGGIPTWVWLAGAAIVVGAVVMKGGAGNGRKAPAKSKPKPSSRKPPLRRPSSPRPS